MSFNIGIQGRFQLQIHKANGELKQELEFKNKILNSAWPATGGSASDRFGFFHLGTGTTPPEFTDTTLQARTRWNTSQVNNFVVFSIDYANGKIVHRTSHQFTPGQATGTFTEIGIGPNVNGTNLFSRSLIKDSNGNPTSITVLSDEYLTINYFFDVIYPITDIPFTCTIKGTQYNGFIRSSGWSSSNSSWLTNTNTGFTTIFNYDFASNIALYNTAAKDRTTFNNQSGSTTGVVKSITNSGFTTTNVNRTIVDNNFITKSNISLQPNFYNGDFRTILLQPWTNSWAPFATIGCLQIDFGALVTKTSTEQFNFTIEIILTRGE